MIKLHGSVVLADGTTLLAANGASTAPEHQGMFTLVSNMSPEAVSAHKPSLSPLELVSGATTDNPVLTGSVAFDAAVDHPLIGELASGAPATSGVLKSTFWNQGLVAFTGVPALELVRLTGVNSVFAGHDQLFVKNNGTSAAPLVISENDGMPVLIGILSPDEVWTSTVTESIDVNISGGYVPLTVSVGPDTGWGAVTKNPDLPAYGFGTTVQLTAAPTNVFISAFDHWEGDASGSANPLDVTMDAPKSITAVFLRDTVPPVIDAFAADKTAECPSTIPDFTADVRAHAHDNMTPTANLTITQDPPAGFAAHWALRR
jgi:hypothetical protein